MLVPVVALSYSPRQPSSTEVSMRLIGLAVVFGSQRPANGTQAATSETRVSYGYSTRVGLRRPARMRELPLAKRA